MPTPNDIASRMVDALRLTEPQLDTSIGSVARKILDAVAGPVSEAFADQHLLNYAYDVDSKSAGDLDDFCAVFGISRLFAQRATGVVTFSRPLSIAQTRVSSIPVGTTVLALTSPPVRVQTLTGVVLGIGQTTVDVPVQAIDPGPQGNVAAGLLVNMETNVDGVTSCTNNNALAFGANGQTDDQLRARFKATVFRNLAGTSSMYRAMALQVQADPSDPNSRAVTKVNVLGAKRTWIEQVQVVSGAASSSLTDAAYIYPKSVYLGANISQGNFLTPDAQFTVTVNNSVYPATLAVAAVGANLPDGLYDLQFDYVPTYSRNDPFATRWGVIGAYVNNRVDLWVNGKVSAQATQACVFQSGGARQFNSVAHDPLQASRFVMPNGSSPAVGDIFVPLGFGPVLTVPPTLSIAASTYTRGTHYQIVHQNDAFGYSPSSLFGLVFFAAATPPPTDSAFSIAYTYNSVPSTVQTSIEAQWRLLGTDVWAHAGRVVKYKLHLAIVFDRTADQAATTTAINVALASFINDLGFNSALQVADLLQVVHNVPGVDNVRFLTSADDAVHYAIEIIRDDGSSGGVIASSGRAIDVYFDDATYPLWDSTRILVKAKNTFGTP